MASRKAPGRKAAPPARRKRPAASASDASRLRKELAEARAQQAATAAILKVISRSPNDVQPVFQAIVEHARRLMGGRSAALIRVVGAELRLAAMTHTTRAGDKALEKFFPAQLSGRGIHSVAAHDRIPVIVRDTDAEWGPQARAMARARGYRSVVAVPLLRKGLAVGVVSVTRKEPGDFSRHEIALLKTFAEQAVIAIENARAFNETKEALERQTATAEILRVIASSPNAIQPVLNAVAERAGRLCNSPYAGVMLHEGDVLRPVADWSEEKGHVPPFIPSMPIRKTFAIGQGFLERRTVHAEDYAELVRTRYTDARANLRRTRARTLVTVPLMREKKAVGMLTLWRRELRPYTNHEIALLETFADQAVIAIENVRLFNETKEALERQTATSEILGVISSSPTDLSPVFGAILENALRICEARLGVLALYDGERFKNVAQLGATAEYADWSLQGSYVADPISTIGRAAAQRVPVQVDDLRQSDAYRAGIERTVKMADLAGARSVVAVPMLKEDLVAGAMVIYRTEVRPFSDKQVDLLRTFANQAVIAIENVRLFNETKEALEQQTAISEILRVISNSPSDVRPVLDAMAERATRICESTDSSIFLVEGDRLRIGGRFGTLPSHAVGETLPLDRGLSVARAVIDSVTIHVADLLGPEGGKYPHSRANAIKLGYRTTLAVPLLREGRALGAISLRTAQVKPFKDKHIALLKTFADQAAIAIQNVRLFNETKESLERQTATAEILKVIASSPSDVQPVFDAIVRNAGRVCDAVDAVMFLRDGEGVRVTAHSGPMRSNVGSGHPLSRETVFGRAIADARPVQVEDMSAATDYPLARELGMNSVGHLKYSSLGVPLLHGGRAVGALLVRRGEVRPFADKQVAMLQTFADQAVIAIENVRLFNETKEALERQTATADILKVIASSPSDVQPVFDAIARSAMRLIDGLTGAVTRISDDALHLAAYTTTGESGDEALKNMFPTPVARATGGVSGKVITERVPVYVADIENDPVTSTEYRELARARGFRSVLGVPMIREGSLLGVISVTRRDPGIFTYHQIELLKTFADQAVIAIENVRLFNETKESLERQTATAEILKVIASSPSDVQPVFDAIAESAKRLLGARSAVVRRLVGDSLEVAAYTSTGSAGDQFVQQQAPQKLSESGTGAMAVRTGAPSIVPDTEDGSADVPEVDRQRGRERGFRSLLVVPMLREGAAIGTLGVARSQPGQFSDHQIDLLKTFADQAVIAIENVRLFNETKEALEQQTATADILKVISSSPTDTQPVFEAIVQSGLKLFPNAAVIVTLPDGGRARLAAIAGAEPFHAAQWKQRHQFPLTREYMHAVAILDGVVIDVPDAQAYGDGPLAVGIRNFLATGSRAITIMPMLRADAAIGTISVIRLVPGSLTEKQIALLRTFADQAVIAIENVRLFNETKEALEQQTATAEILKVISESPTDTQPVFEAIVQSGLRLFPNAAVAVVLPEGNKMRMAAVATQLPAQAAAWRAGFGDSLSRDRMHGAAILDSRLVDIPDAEGEKDGPFGPGVKNFLAGGNRAITIMPMICDDAAIGAISVIRLTPGPLSEKQLALLRTFAAQAVIAIENVRLFNETKEALERQTATAEILQVISGSPTDAQPVFDAIVRSGMKLFSGAGVGIGTVDGDEVVIQAALGMGGAGKGFRMPLSRESASGLAILERKVVNILDTEAPDVPLHARENGRRLNIRSMTQAPMFREGEPIGSIGVMLKEPGGLDDKQLALLKTFADQAVIAIENVRLFKELESRTEALTKSVGQLTALGEVGQAISSTLDLEQVLQTIVSRAVQLTGMDAGSIYEYDAQAEVYRLQAAEKMEPELVEAVRKTPIRKGDGATGRTAVTLEPVQVADIEDKSYQGSRKDNLRRTGYRAVLAVPLLREDILLGALQVFRKTPGPFAPEVVELLKTFATQSAMAIQNARLFREIAEKGKQLEVASRHKSDFLASMSHELRTPLNAILGFNEMLLGQVYGEVPADMQEPLEDIQKSGKHLLRLINNVLDLAKIEAGRMELSLQDYSVQDTVESVRATLRPLAAEKGLEFLATVPQDLPLAYGDSGRITQCLMNLAGNSLKFTKAGKVEIAVAEKDGLLTYRVTDTGVGIPPEKIGSLFTEFKQTDATIASEYGGTGLGLSISKKFVEMHGGRIWIESELGKGSAFIFEIPLRVHS